jgi:hypothetical protein
VIARLELLFVLLVMLSHAPWKCRPEPKDTFVIEDPAFEECVRDTISRPHGKLKGDDVSGIAHLDCPDRGISDLGGLEHFAGLETLSLWENQIEDLSALSTLAQLHDLQLGNNDIADLTPLCGLVNLTALGLGQNRIDDVGALSDLVQLQWLNLDGNELTEDELVALCELTALSWLTVEHKRLADIGALGCLPETTAVYWEFQDAIVSYARSGPRDELDGPEASGAIEPLEGGVLWAGEGGAGDVAFTYRVGERTLPVIPEFSGSVELRGDVLVLHRGPLETAIGVAGDDGAQLCGGTFAEACSAALGLKADGTAHPGLGAAAPPVVTLALTVHPGEGPTVVETERSFMLIDADGDGYGLEYRDLDPYTLASPNQFEAGSCLFMANTGAMEILMNQRAEPEEIGYKGDTDLSERFLMNASEYVPGGHFDWFLTDLMYTYNVLGGSMLDRDYPFIADYIKDTGGVPQLSTPDDPDATLSLPANWIDQLPADWQDQLTATPPVERTVIYRDPARDAFSKWRVGLMDPAHVEMIKHELRTKRAPVIVVYNHFLYWHSNIIIGYDDTAENGGCPLVDQSLGYFRQRGAGSLARSIENHMDDLGGCVDHGVFHVRDSIYGGDDEPMYSYGDTYGFDEPMAERVIQRSYNWVLYLSNHAFSVHRN